MRECKKCGNKIPYWIKINNVVKNLSNRKYCLECIPWGTHNTRQIEKQPFKKGDKLICKRCKKEYIYEKKSACTLNFCGACRQTVRRITIKKRAIEYLSGKCFLCGYNKCYQAMDFHHKDNEMKEFTISGWYNLSWEKLRKELDKCVLLCSNCHREVTAKITKLTV